MHLAGGHRAVGTPHHVHHLVLELTPPTRDAVVRAVRELRMYLAAGAPPQPTPAEPSPSPNEPGEEPDTDGGTKTVRTG